MKEQENRHYSDKGGHNLREVYWRDKQNEFKWLMRFAMKRIRRDGKQKPNYQI